MQADILKLGSEQLFEKLLDYSDGWRVCSSGLETDQGDVKGTEMLSRTQAVFRTHLWIPQLDRRTGHGQSRSPEAI